MKKEHLQMTFLGVACLIIGFFVGIEYKNAEIRSILTKAQDEISQIANSISPATTTIPASTVFIDKKIGDDVVLSTMNLKVNSIEEKNTIPMDFGNPLTAKAETKFVVVDLTATNTTSDPFLYDPDGVDIIDNKQRRYTYKTDSIGLPKGLSFINLPPSIAETGRVVYEVPKDAEGYSLQVGKAGTNEMYRILLK